MSSDSLLHYLFSAHVPWDFLQAASFLALVIPWPLHAFLPLQPALPKPLHAALPLQVLF